MFSLSPIFKKAVTFASFALLTCHFANRMIAEDGGPADLPPGKIEGVVYNDQNQDAIFDQGERPEMGIVVRLLDGDGNKLAEQPTTELGSFGFANLKPGVYRLRFSFTPEIIVRTTGIRVAQERSEHFLTVPVINERANYDFLELGLVDDTSLDGEEATPFTP